jgi:hypothetical protein
LFAQFSIDHVVNFVQPLPRISSKRVCLYKLGCRLATEFARKHIFHHIEHIVWMVRSKRNQVKELPCTRSPEPRIHYSVTSKFVTRG